MASVFTKIIEGKLPSYKIFENEFCLAFLSIDPIHAGHTLIVPKVEIDHFVDVKDPYYSAVFAAAQTIGRAIHAATGCKRVGMAVQGFEVPHFHLHLIPLWETEDFDFRKAKRLPDAEMKAIQEKIVARLKS
ncbi:MAG TPA: HIT family protein [Bdellovibrionota bacterium]|jgi:histidine triad (HIT) family protein